MGEEIEHLLNTPWILKYSFFDVISTAAGGALKHIVKIAVKGVFFADSYWWIKIGFFFSNSVVEAGLPTQVLKNRERQLPDE